MSLQKTDSNNFQSVMRLFRVSTAIFLGFMNNLDIRYQFSGVLESLYIFKFNLPYKDGFTHGIYIRLVGFVSRRILENFIAELVNLLVGNKVELKAVVPHIDKKISLFDYLHTLYVNP